jgi:hypothetical protein
MKKLFLSLLLLPMVASATDLQSAVLDVATSRMSMTSSINGQAAEVVYLGIDAGCDAVSIRWSRQHIDNFRVCNGEVKARNTVSPAWDESVGRPTFISVVNNAILYGQARQKDGNGYLVSARTLNAISHDCKNIEVIVSYEGNLVDRDVREVCGK